MASIVSVAPAVGAGSAVASLTQIKREIHPCRREIPYTPEPLQDRQYVGTANADGLVQVPLSEADLRNSVHGDGEGTQVADPPVDGDLLVLPEPERGIQLATGLEHVGHLSHGDGKRTDISQPFVDGHLLLTPYPQGFVELASRLEHIRDRSHRDGLTPHVAEASVHGELFLPTNPQRRIELPARLEDVRDLSLGDGVAMRVTQPHIHRELLLPADTKRLVELTAIHQLVRHSPPQLSPPTVVPTSGDEGPQPAFDRYAASARPLDLKQACDGPPFRILFQSPDGLVQQGTGPDDLPPAPCRLGREERGDPPERTRGRKDVVQ